MRIEICFEDAVQYQWFLVKDSIEFPDEVPLTYSYNFDRPSLGHVKDIRREDDGAITGEMVFFNPKDEEDVKIFLRDNEMEISMYANNVTDERCEDLRIVYKASLRAVVLVLIPVFPKISAIPEGV